MIVCRNFCTAGTGVKRSGKTSGKAAASRRSKTANRRRRAVAKAGPQRARRGALRGQLDDKTRELNEALERQAATSEVLGVIGASSGKLEPVFQAMLKNATRICDAGIGILFRYEAGAFSAVSLLGVTPAYAEYLNRGPIRPGRDTGLGRLAATRQTVHIADTQAERAYADRDPFRVATAELGGSRSLLNVPMLKDGELVGAIGVYRQEVRPFTDKQVDLVSDFAAQAVIAIENTRLLNELRESLEQQTATSELLSVISASPGELEPVFSAMLENATRICQAQFGVLSLREGAALRVVAMHNPPPAYAELRRREPIWVPTGQMGRIATQAIASKRAVQVPDLAIYNDADPLIRDFAKTTGARSLVLVPLLKEDEVIGTSAIYRQEVRPFTDKQVELLTNFAAQAVIAIENTRLLSELRESLEQQTATAEVLSVISRSPGYLKPVFDAMVESAVRLCDAKLGNLFLYDGEAFYAAALHGASQSYAELRRQQAVVVRDIHPEVPLARLTRIKEVIHIADVRSDPSYIARDARMTELVDGAGARTLLLVPLLKDDELAGSFAIYRQEVRPFADKQVDLVKSFAAQAVIAIENTRLLSELRESLEQQTATADVLRVISSSPGELEPVFQAMLANATRICEAKFGVLQLHDSGTFRVGATHNAPPAFAQSIAKRGPLIRPEASSPLARVCAGKEALQIPDLAEDYSYKQRILGVVRLVEDAGARTLLNVPMLKDDDVIGVINIYRQEVRPFTEKQITLVENFAAQAVIAIENTRLVNELRQSLEQQTATADVLRVISSSPGELEPVFQAMLENAVRICEAKFGNLLRMEGDAYRLVAGVGVPPALAEFHSQYPTFKPVPGSRLDRATRTKRVSHTADDAAEAMPSPPARLGGARSIVCVPMLKDDAVSGAIVIYRQEVRPFNDKQIELLTNFAAQAVIAIENTRLLNELRQRTEDLSKSLEDLRTAQDRLVQTEKLASLGQLTAGIAHEIKNPLNFVNNFSSLSVELIDEMQEELAKVEMGDNARAAIADLAGTLKGNLDKIAQHGKRADAIVKNMLLHSREGSGERRPVDVNALVEESLNLAYHGARAEKQGFNIVLERSFDAQAGEVDLYPQEVTRVLLNIIANGFYAAHKRKSQVGEADFEPTIIASTKNLGDRVEIRIRDNGIGIPPEVKARMFNPFFTTKPAGEGTGLGLSISHDIIVKQHAGVIAVDTQPGQFTEFAIVLPRRAAPLGKPAGTA
jgi:GAF domain-containing protein